MSEKTPGEIACDAFAAHLVATPTGGVIGGCGLSTSWSQYSELGKAAWESAAAVIRAGAVEECAKVADAYLKDGDWDADTCEAIARNLRAVPSTRDTEGADV